MTISISDPRAKRVWFDDDSMWLELIDGRRLSVPLYWFPRLKEATPHQRCNVVLMGRGRGLHWPDVDEDIEVAGLLAGKGDQTRLGRQLTAPQPEAIVQ